MKIDELEKMESEDTRSLTSSERRKFLKLGFAITGLYLGGKVLSLTSVKNAQARMASVVPEPGQYPYNPHYTMVLREHLCIDCERCKTACVETNKVPAYGFRTTILEKSRPLGDKKFERIFMPVLCNQCNNPPCVRVCPTTATYKDPTTGIVRTNSACAEACPTHCRVFGNLSDPESEVYQLLHTPETQIWVLRPESGALPNIYYIDK